MGRYLVTGAAGFIGARVSEMLLAGGHAVVGADNLNDAYDVRLKAWRLAQLEDKPGFEFHRLDISDQKELREFWEVQTANRKPPFDAVINLAARAGVRYSVENPWIYFDTNMVGTLNLLEWCRQQGVPKFVLASSSSVYGRDSRLPYQEDRNTDLPVSPYAASKKAAETLCYTYHYLHGLDVTVFRYFTVYGPAGRPDMALFRLVQWISEGRPATIYGDGAQSRDFTFIEDIARGTIAGLAPLGYEIINLGGDHPASLRDAIAQIETLVGRPAQLQYHPAHPADVPATWADIGKAGRLLGWRPQTSLAEGLTALVHWYQENRAWAKDVATT